MMDVLCRKMPLSALLRGLLERCFAAERLEPSFRTSLDYNCAFSSHA